MLESVDASQKYVPNLSSAYYDSGNTTDCNRS
jgi:hypothetical protein